MVAIGGYGAWSLRLSQEHQCIFDQMKRIEALVSEPDYDSHRVILALRDLLDLAQEHFAHEEEGMISSAFPGAFLRRLDHDYMLRSLRDFIAGLVDTTDRPPSSLCDNLQSWLSFHCRRYDEAYGRSAERRRPAA